MDIRGERVGLTLSESRWLSQGSALRALAPGVVRKVRRASLDFIFQQTADPQIRALLEETEVAAPDTKQYEQNLHELLDQSIAETQAAKEGEAHPIEVDLYEDELNLIRGVARTVHDTLRHISLNDLPAIAAPHDLDELEDFAELFEDEQRSLVSEGGYAAGPNFDSTLAEMQVTAGIIDAIDMHLGPAAENWPYK